MCHIGSADNSDRGKPTGFDQDLPEFDAIIRIDVQDPHGGRSALRLTHKDWLVCRFWVVEWSLMTQGSAPAFSLRNRNLQRFRQLGSAALSSIVA
jgi:hypothetical protein